MAQERLNRYKQLKDIIKKYSILGYEKTQDGKSKRNVDAKPEELAMTIQEGIFEINNMVQEIGAPFGGAATSSWFAEASLGWQNIYAQLSSMAETLLSCLELKDAEANLIDPKEDEKILQLIKEKAGTMKELYRILQKRNPTSFVRNIVDERMLHNSKMSLVRSFFTFYQVEYVAWAQLMYNLCWSQEHTKIEWAVTIYQPPQMPMGRTGEDLANMGDPNIAPDSYG